MRSASRSSSSRRRANMATFAPSAASDSAIARPMPADAPQTIAVRPLRPRSMPPGLSSRFLDARRRERLDVHTRARPHPGGDEIPPAARCERIAQRVPCLCPGGANFVSIRALRRDTAEHAHNLADRRRRGLERAALVVGQVELDDLLDAARTEL